MQHLCDSNVVLATVVERHPHHAAALRWLDTLPAGDTAAFCRQTQLSFLRLLTTEAVMKDAVQTNAAAISVLKDLMMDSRFVFIAAEPVGLEAVWFQTAASDNVSPKAWMDCYLAAFARCYSLRLVTFDKAFEALRRQIEFDLLVLLCSGRGPRVEALIF